jgi:C1A family cysteine protease
MRKHRIRFGWKRDLPDFRDRAYRVTMPVELPELIDLRPLCPPIYDQEDIGSCTAQALAAAYQFEEMKQGKENFIPSRLFIYYNERVQEGTVNQDSGAMIRTGIRTMTGDGVCPETMWEYNTKQFKTKPTDECFIKAGDNQILEYLRITPHTVYEVKHCLVDGFPVAFGFMVFDSFMSPQVASTGMATIPNRRENANGGHAVLAVGYDDSKKCLIVRNSWGTKWGMDGYFYMPYWYIETLNVAADFWTIRLVE